MQKLLPIIWSILKTLVLTLIKKYTLEIGNNYQIVDYFTVYIDDSEVIDEWTENDELLVLIDDEIESMFWDYGEEDEDFEDFIGEMGYKLSEPEGDETYQILFDCRK